MYKRQIHRIQFCLKTTISLSIFLAIGGNVQGAETNLGSVGKTELQQDTGDAVTFTCKGFVKAGTPKGTVPLFDTCRAMVQSGNDVNNVPGEPTGDSLRISEDELAASLQQIATEELANTESMANEIGSHRLNTFLTRLADVRRGVKGFSIVGFSPNQNEVIADNLDSLENSFQVRGGAAGDDIDMGDWSVFLNGNFGTGNRDETDRTDAYDFDAYGLTAGLDYRFTDQLVVGGVANYAKIDTDFDVKPTVSGGTVDGQAIGAAIYGTYFREHYYLDGLIGYGWSDYDLRRSILIPSNNPSISTINETAKANPGGNDFAFSVGGNYQFQKGGFTYGPLARITYLSASVDGYQETGAEQSGLNLQVDSQDWDSLTTVLGGQAVYASNHDFGVLLPQIRIGWVHEFKNDSQNINAVYVADPRNSTLRAATDDPDRDYAELGLGVSSVFKNNVQAYINYDTLLGLSYLNTHLFSIGVRFDF